MYLEDVRRIKSTFEFIHEAHVGVFLLRTRAWVECVGAGQQCSRLGFRYRRPRQPPRVQTGQGIKPGAKKKAAYCV